MKPPIRQPGVSPSIGYIKAKDHCRRYLLSSRDALHPTELCVAVALLDFTNSIEFMASAYLVAYPKLDDLASVLKISRSQVQTWYKRLADRGVLTIEDNRGGRGKTSRVRFNPSWFVDQQRIQAWGRRDSAYVGAVETVAYKTPRFQVDGEGASAAQTVASDNLNGGVSPGDAPVNGGVQDAIQRDDLRDTQEMQKKTTRKPPAPRGGGVGVLSDCEGESLQPPSSRRSFVVEERARRSYLGHFTPRLFDTRGIANLDRVLRSQFEQLSDDEFEPDTILAASERLALAAEVGLRERGRKTRLPNYGTIRKLCEEIEDERAMLERRRMEAEQRQQQEQVDDQRRQEFIAILKPLKRIQPIRPKGNPDEYLVSLFKWLRAGRNEAVHGEIGSSLWVEPGFGADAVIEAARRWAYENKFHPSETQLRDLLKATAEPERYVRSVA